MINTTVILVLLISFVIMLAMGVEICYALGFSSLVACLMLGITPKVLFSTYIGKISNSSLMAIPFFIIMGEFMNTGGITTRLVELADSLIGWMRGGLAMVNCLASMFFGG
ncbi:MAG: TRAP transporter large permease subunit, partial [Spirochaetales bacterium]|nr:TRAP transporter large permease subunit [Spirochaetales bacterium]